jgi:hypothetical protein
VICILYVLALASEYHFTILTIWMHFFFFTCYYQVANISCACDTGKKEYRRNEICVQFIAYSIWCSCIYYIRSPFRYSEIIISTYKVNNLYASRSYKSSLTGATLKLLAQLKIFFSDIFVLLTCLVSRSLQMCLVS